MSTKKRRARPRKMPLSDHEFQHVVHLALDTALMGNSRNKMARRFAELVMPAVSEWIDELAAMMEPLAKEAKARRTRVRRMKDVATKLGALRGLHVVEGGSR